MKRRTIILIIAGVLSAHLILFHFIAGWNPLPPVAHIPGPNFFLGWAKFTDPATKQKMIYQEFTVSTHLDSPPAPPSSSNTPPASH